LGQQYNAQFSSLTNPPKIVQYAIFLLAYDAHTSSGVGCLLWRSDARDQDHLKSLANLFDGIDMEVEEVRVVDLMVDIRAKLNRQFILRYWLRIAYDHLTRLQFAAFGLRPLSLP